MKMTSLLLLFSSFFIQTFSIYPVAIIHGIADACSNSGMEKFTNSFSEKLDNVYTKCIETGGGVSDWFTSFKSQAQFACENINKDSNFQGDFSIVGLSQGALLARYIIESCEMKGRVKRYVSIGGPQMGVGKFPHCASGPFCYLLNPIIDFGVYNSFVQNHVGPAGYFKDVMHYQRYLNASSFLPEINNEREVNESYKERFSALEKMVLIKFSRDTMIIPKETAWFQFYDEHYNVVNMTETSLYKNDTIGLKSLHTQGKISFVELEGNHLQFDEEDVEEYMLPALR